MKIIKNILKYYQKAPIPVKASLWFTFCSFFQKGISTITIPIYTRIMPTTDFGKYSLFQTWYNIFLIIITLNIQSEIINKGIIENKKNKNNYCFNQSLLLIVLTTSFTILYLIFNNQINSITELTFSLTIIMSLEILSNAIIGVWTANKRFEYDYKSIVLVTMIMSILNPIVGIPLVYFSAEKALARIISNAIIPIVFVFFIFIYMMKKTNEFKININWWRLAIISAIPLIPHYLSLVLLNQSDKIMINHFSNASYVGIYTIAHSAGLLLTIVNNSINASFVPWLYEKLKNKDYSKIKDITNGMILIIMVCCLAFIWLGPEIIKIMASKDYFNAIWSFAPITASVFFFFVYTLFVDIEIYFGKSKYISIASIFAAICNIVLNYIFIPKFGYIAAAYTTLFSYFLTMIIHYVFMKKTLKDKKIYTQLFIEKNIAILSIILMVATLIALTIYNNFIIRSTTVVLMGIILVANRNKLYSVINQIVKKGDKNAKV